MLLQLLGGPQQQPWPRVLPYESLEAAATADQPLDAGL